jgi:hypothetical protein
MGRIMNRIRMRISTNKYEPGSGIRKPQKSEKT